LRYHNLKPDYLNERLKQLGKNYQLRVLLVLVDIKEPHNALKHLTRICLLADLTLMIAWTPEEAGKIIETYKMFEFAPAEKIQEKPETDSHSKVSAFNIDLRVELRRCTI
jgi:DNA excision repair protein ERCC-1